MQIIQSPQQKKAAKIREATITLSFAVLAISLSQPAFVLEGQTIDNGSSIMLFFLGWMGFLGGAWECVFWIANPIYLLAAYLFIKKRDEAVILSAVAVL